MCDTVWAYMYFCLARQVPRFTFSVSVCVTATCRVSNSKVSRIESVYDALIQGTEECRVRRHVKPRCCGWTCNKSRGRRCTTTGSNQSDRRAQAIGEHKRLAHCLNHYSRCWSFRYSCLYSYTSMTLWTLFEIFATCFHRRMLQSSLSLFTY